MAAQVINPMENVFAKTIRLWFVSLFHIFLCFLYRERMMWPRAVKHFPLSNLSRLPFYSSDMTACVTLSRKLADEVDLCGAPASGLSRCDICRKRRWGRRAVDLGLVSLQSVLVAECATTSFLFADEIALLVVMHFDVPCECLFLRMQAAISRLHWVLRITY